MSIRELLNDNNEIVLENLLGLQFDRMDTNKDGLISFEDVNGKFDLTEESSIIICKAFFKKDRPNMNKKQFVKKSLKLIKDLY